MREDEILKMIEMFTRETTIRICLVCDETRTAKEQCRIPNCTKKEFKAWKAMVLSVIHEAISRRKRRMIRAKATGKDEITLYFNEGEGEEI